jgi:hypothetical protein
MTNVHVTTGWGRVLALLTLVLGAAVTLSPGSASAAIFDVDILITPDLGGPAGFGTGTYDDVSGEIVVDEFTFEGPLGSPVSGAVGSGADGFELNWFIPDDGNGRGDLAFAVRFLADAPGPGIGGSYFDNSPNIQLVGAWQLSVVPEPSAFALMGIGLLGLGLARYVKRRA